MSKYTEEEWVALNNRTMKQTAVDWLESKLNEFEFDDALYIANNRGWFKQAKEMEKQQMIDAYKKYQSYLIEEFLIKEQAHKGITMHKPFEGNSKTFEQWVETYGSKGSDETKTN